MTTTPKDDLPEARILPCPRYERDERGDSVMFHEATKTWFVYATSKYINGCYRGKGRTKEEARQNSIANTENMQ